MIYITKQLQNIRKNNTLFVRFNDFQAHFTETFIKEYLPYFMKKNFFSNITTSMLRNLRF